MSNKRGMSDTYAATFHICRLPTGNRRLISWFSLQKSPPKTKETGLEIQQVFSSLNFCRLVGDIAGFVKDMGTTKSGMSCLFQKALKLTIGHC